MDVLKSCSPGLPQAHQYDTVNISGNATAILGDVHHYHAVQAQDVHSEAGYLKTILDQLAYPEMQSRLQTLNEPYPNTFRWILSSIEDGEGLSDRTCLEESPVRWDSFTDWLKDGSTPYWISGKMGTGKSTLTEFIVENLSCSHDGHGETIDTIVISHFFWEPGSRLQNSVPGCLRTLLWQLLHFTESMRLITPTVSAASLSSTGRLRNDLIKTIRNFDKTVIVLLDGLDECRETDDILDLVEALAALPNVKLCVSSRREEVYVLQFSDFAKLRLQDLNHKDIALYVETQLLQNPRVRRSPSWNVDSAKDLAESIINDAEGVFLWVRLVIKDLLRGWTNRDSLDKMRKRLEKLPHDIYNLYTELIRRDQEDMVEYAGEAATYFQLLAQSSDRTMSLAAFSFAINGDVRARYLDTDTAFDLPLADLERDVDLETLITWINVRTAGLLEVKEDDDVFYLNNNHRPGPCGRYDLFHKHWVGFIHRSAYTYLQDTSEGQKLVMECSMTPDTLMNVYFESQVAALLVVPGTYNFRFGYNYRVTKLFPTDVGTSPSILQWCRLLQTVYDNLFARGLIIATKDWRVFPLRGQYPSSRYQTIDLCMLFASIGFTEIAEILIAEYEREADHEYMINTLTMIIMDEIYGPFRDTSTISRQVRRLVSHVDAFCSTESSQYRKKVLFQVRLAELATLLPKDEVAPIWAFLEMNDREDYPLSLPASGDLINMFCPYGSTLLVLISAVLSIDTVKTWSYGHDLGKFSSNGRALFFTYWTQGAQRQKVIDPTDADEVLECLRVMVLSQGWKSRFDTRVRTYSFYICLDVCFSFDGDRRTILSKGLQQIFDRSLCCTSFVDCLRYLGKSEEEIDNAVRERVEIAVHTDFEGSEPRILRSLLGSDPQSLAFWYEKYPQLGRLEGRPISPDF